MKFCFFLSILLAVLGLAIPSSIDSLKGLTSQANISIADVVSHTADDIGDSGEESHSSEVEVEEIEKEVFFESNSLALMDKTSCRICTRLSFHQTSYVNNFLIPPRS